MISNRIVSRGFTNSKRNLIVARGFTPTFIERVKELFVRISRGRGAGLEKVRDECDEFTIKASLVRVNRTYLSRPISRSVHVVVCPNPSLFVRASESVRSVVSETFRSILIRAGIKRWR